MTRFGFQVPHNPHDFFFLLGLCAMLRLVHFLSLAVGLGAPCGPRDLDCWTQQLSLKAPGAGSFPLRKMRPYLPTMGAHPLLLFVFCL